MVCAGPDLEAVADALRRKRRSRTARRVTLHVDGDRIHGDVRCGRFDVHGKRRRIAAESLWTDPKLIDDARKLVLELGPLGIRAVRTQWPRGSDFRQVHTQISRTANPDTDDCRRT